MTDSEAASLCRTLAAKPGTELWAATRDMTHTLSLEGYLIAASGMGDLSKHPAIPAPRHPIPEGTVVDQEAAKRRQAAGRARIRAA